MTDRRPALAMLLVMHLAPCASADVWNHYGQAVERAKAAAGQQPAPSWQTPLPDAYVESMQPVAGGDVLLVTRSGDFAPAAVIRIAGNSGEIRWSHPLGDSGVTASPVVAGDIVAVVQSIFPDKIEARMLDAANGAVTWQTEIKAPGTLSPDIATNSLFLLEGKRLERYALDTGKRIWRTKFPRPKSGAALKALEVVGRFLLAADDSIHLFDLATGELEHSHPFADTSWARIQTDDEIAIVTGNPISLAFSLRSGELLWSDATSPLVYSHIALPGRWLRTRYEQREGPKGRWGQPPRRSVIIGLNAGTNAEVWRYPAQTELATTIHSDLEGGLCFADEIALVCLDQESGKEQLRILLPFEQPASKPTLRPLHYYAEREPVHLSVSPEKLQLMTRTGVAQFARETGELLWKEDFQPISDYPAPVSLTGSQMMLARAYRQSSPTSPASPVAANAADPVAGLKVEQQRLQSQTQTIKATRSGLDEEEALATNRLQQRTNLSTQQVLTQMSIEFGKTQATFNAVAAIGSLQDSLVEAMNRKSEREGSRRGAYGKAAIDAFFSVNQGRYWIMRYRTCLVDNCNDVDEISQSHGLRVVDMEERRVSEHLVSAIGFGPVYTLVNGDTLVVADFGMQPEAFPQVLVPRFLGGKALRPSMTVASYPLTQFVD